MASFGAYGVELSCYCVSVHWHIDGSANHTALDNVISVMWLRMMIKLWCQTIVNDTLKLKIELKSNLSCLKAFCSWHIAHHFRTMFSLDSWYQDDTNSNRWFREAGEIELNQFPRWTFSLDHREMKCCACIKDHFTLSSNDSNVVFLSEFFCERIREKPLVFSTRLNDWKVGDAWRVFAYHMCVEST